MKKSRFQTKLILYNIVIFVVILIILLGSLYYYLVGTLQQRARADFVTLSSKTAMQYNNLVYNMDKIALQIAANPTIVSLFSRIPHDNNQNYFIEEPLVANSVVQLLNSYNFKKDSNTRICLYTNNCDFVYTATTMTTVTAVEKFFQSDNFFRTKNYFAHKNAFSMFQNPGKDILNDTTLPSDDYFAIVREIKDYSSNSHKSGYVEVQQSVSRMDSIFGDLGQDSYAAVLDTDGNIIYQSPSLRSSSEHMQSYFAKLVTVTPAANGLSRSGQDYLCCYEIEEAPLRVLFLRKGSVMMQPVLQFTYVLLGAMLLVLVVVIVSERLLVKRLTAPLVALSNSVREISLDNLQLEVDEKDSDELQQLGIVFNSMLWHLRVAIDSQLISKTNELKSHLFALQSQMNPHFIHNILAIISMEALQDGNDKITTMCTKLSRMLSYTSSMGCGLVTVSQELVHAGNYMELMKQRYEELFEYTVDCPPKLTEYEIPKLIIQPLCENCFHHAFSNQEDIWHITVRGYVQDDDSWRICIEDNGKGFTTDFIERFEKMKSEITLDNMKDYLEEISIDGLTIPNIYMRLLLCYGNDFIFQIENISGGARVTFGGRANDTSSNC